MEKPKPGTSLKSPNTLNVWSGISLMQLAFHRLNARIVIQCKARFGQSSLDEPQYSYTFTLLNVFFKNAMFKTISILKKPLRYTDQIFNRAATPTLL
jgi:hypothetical protein